MYTVDGHDEDDANDDDGDDDDRKENSVGNYHDNFTQHFSTLGKLVGISF